MQEPNAITSKEVVQTVLTLLRRVGPAYSLTMVIMIVGVSWRLYQHVFYRIVLINHVVLIIGWIVFNYFCDTFLKKYQYKMDTKEYENQKIIFLANTFAGGSKTFSKEVRVEFIPKIMNVKSIHYNNNTTEAKTRILQMDRLGIIGTFADSNTANNSNVTFKLGRIGWSDGNYTFRVLESENDIDTDPLAGRIVLCLEFLG